MSDNATFLDTFPNWLRTLGHDASELSELVSDKKVQEDARQFIVGGLNYLFKSLDLIPDGIDDIGYLDDAFVLRVAADLARDSDNDISHANLLELADQSKSIREFLGSDYDRLEAYVKGLKNGAARGRSVNDILENDATQGEFLSDVRGFNKSYESPAFGREEKNLIKLRAFFDAKLPK